MVNKINVEIVNIKMLEALFGLCGCVEKIIMDIHGKYALVEYRLQSQAEQALASLANKTFFGSPLKIKFSKYQTLSLKTLKSQIHDQRRYIRSNDVSYLKKSADNFRGLSDVLYIRDASKELTTQLLYELISETNQPKKVYELRETPEGNRDFLVEFSSVS